MFYVHLIHHIPKWQDQQSYNTFLLSMMTWYSHFLVQKPSSLSVDISIWKRKPLTDKIDHCFRSSKDHRSFQSLALLYNNAQADEMYIPQYHKVDCILLNHLDHSLMLHIYYKQNYFTFISYYKCNFQWFWRIESLLIYVLAISVTECEMEKSQRTEVSKFRIWSWLLSPHY